MKKTILLLALSLSVIMAFSQTRTPGPNKLGHAPMATLNVIPVDNTTLTPQDLVEAILGPGVTYSNVNFVGTFGTASSSGMFSNGTAAGISIEEGILLSSGFALNALGPNVSDNISGELGTGSDDDLDLLVGGFTLDKNVLEFDFVPTDNNIYIEYVFGSEEYNEYVGDEVNDCFAFFIDGVNIALIPSTTIPVTINTLNYGDPYGSVCNYCEYFVNNDLQDGGPFYDIECDGFTTKLTGQATVTPDVTHHIKIAIADRYDQIWDSFVFLKADSFSTDNPDVPVSNWALFIGIGLILIFAVVRFRRLS